MGAIDSSLTIENWAKLHGLFIEKNRNFPGRYIFHKSSRNGECFQISVFPAQDGIVVIEAWSIETNDGRDVHCRWDVLIDELRAGLDVALKKVDGWLGS